MLEINDLSFKFPSGKDFLFNSYSQNFSKGELISILGPNGTGKSTFLNLLAKRLTPTFGSVLIFDRETDISDFNYMLQDSDRLLFSNLSISQNIELINNNSINSQNKNKLLDLLFPNKENYNKYPNVLSGGQRQRAVLMRTILDIPNFNITLLDEPFSRISIEAKNQVYKITREIVKQHNKILFFVTHDITEAIILGDKTLVFPFHKQVETFDTSFVTDKKTLLNSNNLFRKIELLLNDLI